MKARTQREIIDCHWHPALDRETDIRWYGLTSGDIPNQIAMLKRAGISRACGSVIRPLKPESFAEIRALNDSALAIRDRFPKFYIPGIHIHPHFPDESCREIERCCGGAGVRWIGELVGYMMGFGEEFATPAALTILREAGKHHAAVNIHASNLETIEQMCRALPEVNFVLAHPGDGSRDFPARLELVAKCANLHFDISGSGIDRYGILRRTIDVAGKGKLLFGSDYTINNPAVYVQGALFEDLSADEYDALFRGNFLRLCGLE